MEYIVVESEATDMELYIGGYAQGKLAYVQKKYSLTAEQTIDGAKEEFNGQKSGVWIFNHFHLWVRRHLKAGEDVGMLMERLLAEQPDCIILSDEIGNGIVPIDPAEREYREQTGRLLCELAEKAAHVERIVCGIGEKIK